MKLMAWKTPPASRTRFQGFKSVPAGSTNLSEMTHVGSFQDPLGSVKQNHVCIMCEVSWSILIVHRCMHLNLHKHGPLAHGPWLLNQATHKVQFWDSSAPPSWCGPSESPLGLGCWCSAHSAASQRCETWKNMCGALTWTVCFNNLRCVLLCSTSLREPIAA